MLLSLYRWRISSYINCLSEHFNDHKLVASIAFLIASAKGDDLEFFAPTDDYIGYFDKLENVKGECDSYVNLFSNYDATVIKSVSRKLWCHYLNKPVEFTAEEKQLLSKLGIKV